MRHRWLAVPAFMAAMMMAGFTPCTGPSRADAPGTALTADGDGVLLGSPTAPTQLEIFCEPQCPFCAKFEAASDADIDRHLDSGRLAVTYRWLTALDEKRHNTTSSRIATALMAAADPATPATAYQAFVADLYRHQPANGDDGPTVDDIAAMARESGLPPPVVDRIAAGAPAVDTTAMSNANKERLTQVRQDKPSTPTVYHLNTNQLVDTDDAGWLETILAR